MAYEVTKLVHGRPYRYRVRSERDETTGKYRNRWTYLGRADAGDVAPAKVRRNARTALLDALARLLERGELDSVTASAVSTEAGLAHGTFYRYFRNKQDAIVALLERVRGAKLGELDELLEPPADADEARAAWRRWAEGMLRSPARDGGLIRALYVLISNDAALQEHRRLRREALAQNLGAYLAMLGARGFASIDDPEETAAALVAMIGGIFREAVMNEPLTDARIAAAGGVIERAIFGRLPA
jgi:TetR/AcrR family transcriptional repressor of nem operon